MTNYPIIISQDSGELSPLSGIISRISENSIKHNNVSGDINLAGVQNIFQIQSRNPNALIELIERSKQLSRESDEYKFMLEELQSFLSHRPNRKIIGLEAKLLNGGRDDLFDDATYLENKFSRRLAQGQHSPSAQTMFMHCLSQINSAFSQHIRPLIRSGQPQVIVDAAIKQLVIDPIHQEIMVVDCSLSTELVRGMLFFLTGKCHIQWE